MRLEFVCPNLQAGGAERHWSILIPRLAARGHQVQVLTIDGRGPFFDVLAAAGVPITSVADRGPGRNLAAIRALRRTAPDVIISRAVSADGLSLIASRWAPGVMWAANWHHPTGMRIRPRRRAILSRVLPRADAVIAVASSQIRELTELGVRREAIHVVANGTDFTARGGRREATRRELGVAEHEVAFLLVGRLHPQKRVDQFIEAIAGARRSRPDVVGLVAGTGPDRERLAGLISARGAGVRLLGRRDDIPDVLAAADALCLVSDYEALPFVALEAMASGLPVITTRVGAMPEVVVNGATGLVIEVGDVGGVTAAIERLAADPALRGRLGAAGRVRQQTLYAADAMVDGYAGVLSALGS